LQPDALAGAAVLVEVDPLLSDNADRCVIWNAGAAERFDDIGLEHDAAATVV
jgi:hypothetical protein